MKSIAIIPQTNTFVRGNGRFRFTESNLEYMRQKVHHAVSIFLGEWFLDRTLGIPYIPTGDEKHMHRRLIETALQVRITSVKGVTKLLSFTTTLDKVSRTLRVTFAVQIDNGETFDDTVDIEG
jgi:hypothetical protein